MNHSEAMRNVAPPLQRGNGILSRIRSLLAQEAAVSRALGEKPQPNPLIGAALITFVSIVLFGVMVASLPAASGPHRTGTTTPASAEAAAGVTGDRR